MKRIGLFAKTRKTGRMEMVCGPEMSPQEQRKKLEEIYTSGSDEYSGGGLFSLEQFSAWLVFPQPKKAEKTMKSKAASTLAPLVMVLLALSFTTFSVSAQVHTYELVDTASIAATAGTNINKNVDCRKQGANIPFQFESMANASGAYTVTIPFQRSVDGVVFGALEPFNLVLSFNGVTKQVIVTNIPTYGALWLKIPHLTNATASISSTNFVIKRGVRVEPGY